MLIQARWDEMRQKLQVVKSAYVSRHYAQCAKYGERLLAEVQGEIHPIHLAYLNFYTALSHDTLAREATLKNRYRELNLAEKHYTAAISALTPSSIYSAQTSHSSSSEYIWKFRHPSQNSSIDSNSSSYSTLSSSSYSSDLDYTHDGLGSFSFPQPPSQTHKARPSTTLTNYTSNTTTSTTHNTSNNNMIIPSRPQTPSEFQFASDTTSFVHMVRGHLSNVKDLKNRTGAPTVRFTFPTAPQQQQQQQQHKERIGSRVFEPANVSEKMRRERMTRTFRPRFDPEEVRRLCGDALAELGY